MFLCRIEGVKDAQVRSSSHVCGSLSSRWSGQSSDLRMEKSFRTSLPVAGDPNRADLLHLYVQFIFSGCRAFFSLSNEDHIASTLS